MKPEPLKGKSYKVYRANPYWEKGKVVFAKEDVCSAVKGLKQAIIKHPIPIHLNNILELIDKWFDVEDGK